MLYRLICNSNHALSQKFDKNEGLKAQFEEIKREHYEKSEQVRKEEVFYKPYLQVFQHKRDTKMDTCNSYKVY